MKKQYNYSKAQDKTKKEELMVKETEPTVEECIETSVEENVEPVYVGVVKTKPSTVKLNVRIKPDMKAEVSRQLNNGEKIYIETKTKINGFYKLCGEEGKTEYCRAEFVVVQE